MTPRHFAWQAWHLVTSSFVSHGRRGAWRHPPSFHVAGVALCDIHLRIAWQAWHLGHWAGSGGTLGPGLVAGDAAALCVAGVALGDIKLRFTWQAWHLATSTLVSRGRRGTLRHPPSYCLAGVALRALGWLWWRAWAPDWSPVMPRHFAWHAWHLVTSAFVSRIGRR